MKSNVLSKDNIVVAVLKPDNYEKYAGMLASFDSVDKSINYVIRKRVDYFREKGSLYDNRDTVYLYLFEDPETNERQLIGYLAFAASSIKTDLNSEDSIVVPSVVINTFAVSKRFTEKSGFKVDMGDGVFIKCSVYIIEDFFYRMDALSSKIGLSAVYLFAQQRDAVVKFYCDTCRFVKFTRSNRVWGMQSGALEYSLLRPLENAKHRGI